MDQSEAEDILRKCSMLTADQRSGVILLLRKLDREIASLERQVKDVEKDRDDFKRALFSAVEK